VKVGRSALDEMAIRSIEASHPDVEFDWSTILKEQGPAEPAAPPPRPGPDRRISRRPPEPRATRPAPAPPPARVPEAVVAAAPPPVVERPAAPRPPAVPVAFEEPAPEERPPTAAHARLGAEGVLRLRARHAEILARISERVEDEVRCGELKVQAERLNPDSWVTEEDVRSGIDGYEAVLGSLRGVVGQGRRRRRRSGPRDGSPVATEASSATGTSGAAAGNDEEISHVERQDEGSERREEPL
jgi:hypothetical protein